MATVRAKFKVHSKTETMHGEEKMVTVKMAPVYGGKDDSVENKQFWKWTPAGLIELGTINFAAGDKFELNKEYYVDFTPAE